MLDYYRESLLLLSLCHSIITEETPEGIIYNSPSPDELALVNFAKLSGYEYLGTDKEDIIHLKVTNLLNKEAKNLEFKLEHILQFSSKRKRMSVIVRNPKGELVLYIKGADSIVLPRCK